MNQPIAIKKYKIYKNGDYCPLFKSINGVCDAKFGRDCIVVEDEESYRIQPIDENYENSIIISELVYIPKKKLIILCEMEMEL